jgi:protein gp37
MAEKTNIQWCKVKSRDPDTDAVKIIGGGTINVGGGCNLVNGACTHCYAMNETARLDAQHKGIAKKIRAEGGSEEDALKHELMYDGLVVKVKGRWVWTGKINAFPWRIDEWLRKQGGKPYFNSSLTDYWHDGYDDKFLAKWYAAFGVAHRQRLLVLTKRPERQLALLTDPAWKALVMEEAKITLDRFPKAPHLAMPTQWPFQNVWNGASAGEAKVLEVVLKTLLKTPSVCQWLSLEPLYADPCLGEALAEYSPEDRKYLMWAIFGGESGQDSRPMDLEWVRKGLIDCERLRIAAFVKQKGEVLARAMDCADKKGGDITEWPPEVQVRQYPEDLGLLPWLVAA